MEDASKNAFRRGAPDWQALLRWSAQHSDGTVPTRAMDETERAWLESALRQNMIDEVQRMKEISYVLELEEPPDGYDEEQFIDAKAELLEEMQDLVESIDNARDLKGVGGFGALMELMSCEHAKLRCRAAEVIATSVQNNPDAQEWALEGGALNQILKLFEDVEPECRTKGMLAVSCLLRGHKPAREAFQKEGGYERLLKLMDTSSGEVKTLRKIAQFLSAMLIEEPTTIHPIVNLGFHTRFTEYLDHEDSGMREAALRLLLSVYDADNHARNIAKRSTLPAILEVRDKALRAVDGGDEETILEEHDLVKKLQALLDLADPNCSTVETGTMVLDA